LFALLNQFCGYNSAQEGSTLPIFDDVFTDIGDEQSIEQDSPPSAAT
jgi:DNA mismatch repair protein MutS2